MRDPLAASYEQVCRGITKASICMQTHGVSSIFSIDFFIVSISVYLEVHMAVHVGGQRAEAADASAIN